MRNTKIPYNIRTSLEVIFSYAKNCDQWIRVKKELMNSLIPSDRKLFSKSCQNKRQKLNEMEKEIIELWIMWGGKRLKLPQDYE